jgi:calcineurin-like phosphoesterase family protein
MSDIWFFSDHHLLHKNILKFTDDSGEIIRRFSSLDEMHETMIENNNSLVKDGDKVYWLGDVTFEYGPEFAALMARFKGQKRLIIGNHDKIKGTDLIRHFKKVNTLRLFKEYGFICSHVPIHVGSFRHKAKFNVHGHTHHQVVLDEHGKPDPRYINVCMEQTDYKPVNVDWLKQEITKRSVDM